MCRWVPNEFTHPESISTLTALVFLDSRDLIDCVEHNKPCSYETLRERLLDHHVSLVYTFTNVMESIPRARSLSYQATFLNRLESLPHIIVKHTAISTYEFADARESFHAAREPNPCLPVVPSFWRIFQHPPDSIDSKTELFHAVFDQLGLAEQIILALSDRKSFDFSSMHRDDLEIILDMHRKQLATSEPGKVLFRHAVTQQLHSMNLTVDDIEKFAGWLFRFPTVCPGWRLGHEAFQELRRDRDVKLRKSDVPDLSHVYLVPYVALATLDGQWRSYCERATRRLCGQGFSIDYDARIVANTATVLDRLGHQKV